MKEIPKKLREFLVKEKPKNIKSNLKPDFYFKPGLVLEITGAEITESPNHTCAASRGKGLALRFPKFLRFRPDKSPRQATTTKEIINLFKKQRK